MEKRWDEVARKTWPVAIVSSLVVVIIAPSVSLAAIIGIDSRHGVLDSATLGAGDAFGTFRRAITALGHTIMPLSSFETADLAGLDTLVLNHAYSQNNPAGYSASEISAIHVFVNGGGGLVVHAEGGYGSDAYVDNLNILVSPYGVTYAASATEESGHTITDLAVHPVTNGVTMFGVDYQRREISITAPAIDLTIGSGPDDALAVVDGVGGAGNVVLLSDTSMWSNPGAGSDRSLTFGDNQLLLENIIQFTIPEPATVSLLCLGSLALLRKRRTSSWYPHNQKR
ncbi:MAG: PEP-CTERM sorting domain-containing protein [Phycisphaerales bacterium]